MAALAGLQALQQMQAQQQQGQPAGGGAATGFAGTGGANAGAGAGGGYTVLGQNLTPQTLGDVGQNIAALPLIGDVLSKLIPGLGEGAGKKRRTRAKEAVLKSQPLNRLRGYANRGSGTLADAEWLTRTVGSVDPEAHAALVQVAQALLATHGDQRNLVGDVVKYLYTSETVRPRRAVPSQDQLLSWLSSPLNYYQTTRFAA